MTAKFSMRTTLLCAARAIALMTAIPVAHPASAQGLNDIVRNLNNTMNPSDAQRREDQLRREDRAHRREGWSEQEQYGRGHRRTSESRDAPDSPLEGAGFEPSDPRPTVSSMRSRPRCGRWIVAPRSQIGAALRAGGALAGVYRASFLIERQEADRSARAARRRPTPTKSRSRPLNPCRAEAATRFQ
jgi:hypothetical protein